MILGMIEKIFEAHRGGTVLFLGRVTHFTVEELRRFLEAEGMVYADSYAGEVALLVLSSRMTPAEEQLSYDLYEAGVPDVSLEQFERYMSRHIKPDALLMSLKLSGDQARLQRLLGNEAFSDALYLKLVQMVDWGEEGIHENDANRDVTISFVKRFFRPEGFRDPAMVYAPTTMMIIAKDTTNPQVLEAILTMPNHEIKISRYEQKKPKNLREMAAFNPHLSTASIQKLLSCHDADIDYFLASNAAVGEQQLLQIYARADSQTKVMMTQHTALPDRLFELLLEEEDAAILQNLLTFGYFDARRLERVWESPYLAYIGANRQIGAHLDSLMALENPALDSLLAANPTVSSSSLEILYARYGRDIADRLATHPGISQEMAEALYALEEPAVTEALAANPATPKEILDTLCMREERELNRHLAANPSVDLYWLRQFQLDTSLIRILAENETYGTHILRGLGL